MPAETSSDAEESRDDLDSQFFGSATVLHATGEATDGLLEQVTMPPGMAAQSRAQLLDAMKDGIVGKAAYVGRFRQ